MAKDFFTRAAKHMGISNLTGKRVESMNELTVSGHLLQCNTTIDFEYFDILASETNSFRDLTVRLKTAIPTKRCQTPMTE